VNHVEACESGIGGDHTKHPSDNQIEQDMVDGKKGVAGLGTRMASQSPLKLHLFKVRQENLKSAVDGCIL